MVTIRLGAPVGMSGESPGTCAEAVADGELDGVFGG
jgi:hypothetical protein